MTHHLSGPELERLAAGDEPPDHAINCNRCAERVAAIADARARYLAAHPADELVRAARERARRRGGRFATRGTVAVGLACALAAGGLLVAWPSGEEPAIRTRGAAIELVTYVRRGSETFVASDGVALHAGDRLSFAYAAPDARRLLLLGIDDSGTISRYAAGAPIAPGRGQIPVGLRLDSRRGEERLVAVFARTEADEEEVRAALAGALAAARAEGGGVGDMRLQLSGDHATIWFRKP
ncbi:MAG TPA: hypothetical protein VNO33_08145 [Kofleriaceae bacterium]|nr:hypothetical protein [Kofleriaceae bacterium]